MEDSNLQTSFQKMPFEMPDEFPVIPGNLGIRDFSRANCEKALHSLLRRLRGRHIGREPVWADNFWIFQARNDI
jgi:hypothetical protein